MLRDEGGEVRLRHVGRAADQEGLPHRLGPVQGEQEPAHQVVDVDRVVEGAAGAHDRVAAPRDGAEELEKARLPWPVDGARAHHGDGNAAPAVEVERQRLGLRLRGLVDVAGGERGGLVGRGVLDVAVDTHRRRVDEAPDALAHGRLQ